MGLRKSRPVARSKALADGLGVFLPFSALSVVSDGSYLLLLFLYIDRPLPEHQPVVFDYLAFCIYERIEW